MFRNVDQFTRVRSGPEPQSYCFLSFYHFPILFNSMFSILFSVVLCVSSGRSASIWHGLMMFGLGGKPYVQSFLYNIHALWTTLQFFICEPRLLSWPLLCCAAPFGGVTILSFTSNLSSISFPNGHSERHFPSTNVPPFIHKKNMISGIHVC